MGITFCPTIEEHCDHFSNFSTAITFPRYCRFFLLWWFPLVPIFEQNFDWNLKCEEARLMPSSSILDTDVNLANFIQFSQWSTISKCWLGLNRNIIRRLNLKKFTIRSSRFSNRYKINKNNKNCNANILHTKICKRKWQITFDWWFMYV